MCKFIIQCYVPLTGSGALQSSPLLCLDNRNKYKWTFIPVINEYDERKYVKMLLMI